MGKLFEGLRDTGEILKQVVEEERISGLDAHALDRLMRAWKPRRLASPTFFACCGGWRGVSGVSPIRRVSPPALKRERLIGPAR